MITKMIRMESGHELHLTEWSHSVLRRYDHRTGGTRSRVYRNPSTSWELYDPRGNLVSVGSNQQLSFDTVEHLCAEMISTGRYRHHLTGTIGAPA